VICKTITHRLVHIKNNQYFFSPRRPQPARQPHSDACHPHRELLGAIRLVANSVKLPYLCDIFYFRCHLPWKTNVFCFFFNVFHGRKEVIVKKSFVFHGRRASFLHFFISSMEDGRFFSVQPLSAVAEAPRLLWFPYFGGVQEQ